MIGSQLLLVSLGDATHGLFVQVSVNNPVYLEGGTVDAGTWKRVQMPIADLMAGVPLGVPDPFGDPFRLDQDGR